MAPLPRLGWALSSLADPCQGPSGPCNLLGGRDRSGRLWDLAEAEQRQAETDARRDKEVQGSHSHISSPNTRRCRGPTLIFQVQTQRGAGFSLSYFKSLHKEVLVLTLTFQVLTLMPGGTRRCKDLTLTFLVLTQGCGGVSLSHF